MLKTLTVALIVYCLVAPLAACLAILMPRQVDLGRLGRRAQAHDIAILVGMAVMVLTLLLVAVVTGLGRSWMGVELGSAVTLVLLLALAAALGRGLVEPLSRLVDWRREALLMSCREGS